MFTTFLMNAMETALDNGEQIILFQNRRGYAPQWSCDDCGLVPQCTRCDVSLTYHKFQKSTYNLKFNFRKFIEHLLSISHFYDRNLAFKINKILMKKSMLLNPENVIGSLTLYLTKRKDI